MMASTCDLLQKKTVVFVLIFFVLIVSTTLLLRDKNLPIHMFTSDAGAMTPVHSHLTSPPQGISRTQTNGTHLFASKVNSTVIFRNSSSQTGAGSLSFTVIKPVDQSVSSSFYEVVVQGSKTVLYLCMDYGCGGLADRQKGIVSAFVLAAMLKRPFKAHVTVPCDLANFLPPNKTDWRITDNEFWGDHQQVRVIDSEGVKYIQEILKHDDLDSLFPRKYTSFFWNMELVQYFKEHRLAKQIPWLRDLSVADIYKFVLARLFSLKPDLQADLQTFRKSAPSKLICAQVRLGGNVGNFVDSDLFYSLDDFASVSNFLKGLDKDESYRFLVTSDSEEATRRAEKAFPNRSLRLPGPITHVDKTKGGNACDGLRKAILDEYALSMCDVLVISESGIGKMAAFMRGTDENLFLFMGKEIKPFKRNDQFPKYKQSWR